MALGKKEARAWDVGEGGTQGGSGGGNLHNRQVRTSPGFKNAVGLREAKLSAADVQPSDTLNQLSTKGAPYEPRGQHSRGELL